MNLHDITAFAAPLWTHLAYLRYGRLRQGRLVRVWRNPGERHVWGHWERGDNMHHEIDNQGIETPALSFTIHCPEHDSKDDRQLAAWVREHPNGSTWYIGPYHIIGPGAHEY